MKRLGLGIACALLALGGVATTATAETVKFEGCAVSTLSGACTLINPVGQSYMVNRAKKPVPVMVPIRLTGKTVPAEPTMCGVPALTDIKWKKIKKKGC
jgi:hypothetical protein